MCQTQGWSQPFNGTAHRPCPPRMFRASGESNQILDSHFMKIMMERVWEFIIAEGNEHRRSETVS